LAGSTQHLNRNVNDAVRWLARGDLLVEGEMYDEAIQNFGRALQLEPSNVDVLNARAQVYVETGQLQLALDDCDESIVIESSQQALSIRGDVWLAIGNLDNAISDFEGALRFDSSVATAYRDRAARHKDAGNQSRADEDLEAAKRIEDAFSGRLVDESEAPRVVS
jgi:tetratricopeptide (TPR) repeat protein